MKVRFSQGLIGFALVSFLLGCTAIPSQQNNAAASRISLGSPKSDDGKFMRMHESFLARAQAGPVDLLFLGDSITAGWDSRAKDVWQQYYGQYRAANFGIGGDRSENVLWRLDNGELDLIRPKVIVLLIGTNNSGSFNGMQIASLNKQIITLIQQKSPQSKVLLLAVFPRGPRTVKGVVDDGKKRMQAIHVLNQELAKLDDGQRVRFLDIGAQFLKNGAIPDELMPDQLHPSNAGYQVWAQAMQPLLNQMMQE